MARRIGKLYEVTSIKSSLMLSRTGCAHQSSDLVQISLVSCRRHRAITPHIAKRLTAAASERARETAAAAATGRMKQLRVTDICPLSINDIPWWLIIVIFGAKIADTSTAFVYTYKYTYIYAGVFHLQRQFGWWFGVNNNNDDKHLLTEQ